MVWYGMYNTPQAIGAWANPAYFLIVDAPMVPSRPQPLPKGQMSVRWRLDDRVVQGEKFSRGRATKISCFADSKSTLWGVRNLAEFSPTCTWGHQICVWVGGHCKYNKEKTAFLINFQKFSKFWGIFEFFSWSLNKEDQSTCLLSAKVTHWDYHAVKYISIYTWLHDESHWVTFAHSR